MTLRRLASISLILFIATASSAAINTPLSIEAALHKLFKEAELLTAVGGLKPVTMLDCPFCKTGFQYANDAHSRQLNTEYRKQVHESYQYLLQAQKSGVLNNPDIEFMVIQQSSGEGASIVALNRPALERIIHDPEAMQVIGEYMGKKPTSVSEAISLFETAAQADGFRYGPGWANAVVGVMLGYPPKDVKIYAKEAEAKKIGMNKRLPHYGGGNGFGPENRDAYLGSFVNLTEEGAERKKYLAESGETLLENFRKLRAQGRSYVDIFNQPGLVKEGVAPYPISNTLTSRMIDCMLPRFSALIKRP